MSAKSTIGKEIFAPHDERMLGAVQVKRRTKKKIPFLATGGQGEYLTYICLSGKTNYFHIQLFFALSFEVSLVDWMSSLPIRSIMTCILIMQAVSYDCYILNVHNFEWSKYCILLEYKMSPSPPPSSWG